MINPHLAVSSSGSRAAVRLAGSQVLDFSEVCAAIALMAGPLRVEFSGAVQHVMACGNHGRSELASLPKGQPEKQVLAWWLYGNTTVKRRRLAEQLEMGYETRVSQAAGAVEASRDPAVLEVKNKLLEVRT